jgi:hypothetical protein
MRVTQITATEGQVRAQVTWEQAPRAPLDLQVTADHGTLTADPNAFLLVCYLPAWRAGEERVVIDGAICPVLRANLSAATQVLAGWQTSLGPRPRIEADTAIRLPQTGVGSFLSGGIDSLATLRINRLTIPADHPESIGTAILIDYQGIEQLDAEETEARFRERSTTLEAICASTDVTPLRLRTNARALDNSMEFWMRAYHGAMLAGLAHVVSHRLRKVHIAASYDAANLAPFGSHPLLHLYYGSAHLQIGHHGFELSRWAKTAIVADWPIALKHLHVCVAYRSGGRNCGRCEKCLRTMLALVSMGKLGACDAFDADDLEPRHLKTLTIKSAYQASCYRETAIRLREVGRIELAAAVKRKLAAHAAPTSPSLRRRLARWVGMAPHASTRTGFKRLNVAP